MHVGIAKEGSPAGEEFNFQAYDMVIQRIDHAGCLVGKTKSLDARLQEVLQKYMPTYVRSPNPAKQLKVGSQLKDDGEVSEKYGRLVNIFTLAEHADEKLSLQSCLFEPIVDEFLKMEDYTDPLTGLTRNIEMRYLTIEAAGVAEEDVKVEERMGGQVSVKILKKVFIDEDMASPYNEDERSPPAPIRQTEGIFQKTVNLFQHECAKPLYTFQDGMFVMKMPVRNWQLYFEADGETEENLVKLMKKLHEKETDLIETMVSATVDEQQQKKTEILQLKGEICRLQAELHQTKRGEESSGHR